MNYLVTTADGIDHLLPGITEGDLTGISSPNTRGAIETAIAAGHYTPYTPAEPIALPAEPNPAAFRAALASAPTWLAWAQTLPSVHYTNLTIAAANGNWGEAQAIYNAIKASTPPAEASIDAWQALADGNGIPITF